MHSLPDSGLQASDGITSDSWLSLLRPQVLFNDHLLHGSSARTAPGERKMVVFRYLPQPQSSNRFGYEPSAELMGRLTDVRREMLVDLNHPDPQPPVRNPTQPGTHARVQA